MKTKVYSWRLSQELKSDLEREARLRKVSVSHLLEIVVGEWLKKSALDVAGDEVQQKLHAAAFRYIGSIAGGNSRRSETARETIRRRLSRRYAR